MQTSMLVGILVALSVSAMIIGGSLLDFGDEPETIAQNDSPLISATSSGLALDTPSSERTALSAPNRFIPLIPSTGDDALSTSLAPQSPQLSPRSASGYYPNTEPALWYALPGQTLSFSGTGFAPNETVTVSGTDVRFSGTAAANGTFNSGNAFVVPFGWQNSFRTFTVEGSISRFPNTMRIAIGSFYPQLEPSSYWVSRGQSMSAQGTAFAPNEEVRLMLNGQEIARTRADGKGGVAWVFAAPGVGASFDLRATGLSSGQSSVRTIYLHP